MQRSDEQNENLQKEVSRRTFLSYVNIAIGGFITAVISIPIVGAAILPALSKIRPSVVTAGAIGDFQVEQPKNITVTITVKDGWIQSKDSRGIWVIKHSDTNFTVFNGRCVHLGCAYNWYPNRKEFICPCHGGTYTIAGKVVAGPPPRPLDTLNWRIQQGKLIVDYEDFRLGIPQKEAV